MTDTGIHNELVPQLLRSNEGVTLVILYGFLITAYVLSQKRQMMIQGLRNLLSTRERNSIFFEQTAGEVSSKILLLLQTCLFSAVITISHFLKQDSNQPITLLLIVYTAVILLFYLLKWCLYRFVNWIFFDKNKNNLWTSSYFFLHSLLGILFLPAILFTVYCDFSHPTSVFFYLFMLILLNLLLIYKCFCIFFNKKYGAFYLIMYFCTLEILPILLLWKGVDFINITLT